MMHIPGPRAGPLVATQSLHKKLSSTNSYHNNMVRFFSFMLCYYFVGTFFNFRILSCLFVLSNVGGQFVNLKNVWYSLVSVTT